jgi:hypothetical protein
MLGISTLTILTALSAPALAGPSSAVTHELSWTLDSQTMGDDQWDTFGWTDVVNTLGVTAGYGLKRNLTLMVGIQHRRYSKSWNYYQETNDYWDSSYEVTMAATQLSLGPKLSMSVTPWLRPYVTTQGTAWIGKMGVDEDISDEDNLNQMSWRGLSPGVKAAAGVEFIPIRGDRVHLATNLDFGYGIAAKMKFSDDGGTSAEDEESAPVGELGMQGLHVSWGIGLHF